MKSVQSKDGHIIGTWGKWQLSLFCVVVNEISHIIHPLLFIALFLRQIMNLCPLGPPAFPASLHSGILGRCLHTHHPIIVLLVKILDAHAFSKSHLH